MLITKDKQRRHKPIKVPTKSVSNAEFFKQQVSESKHRAKAPNAPEQKKLKTRDLMCSQLLRQGYIQSYIDMFYISHKQLPNVMLPQNYAQQVSTENVEELSENDINSLNDLSLNLKRAEAYSAFSSAEKEKGMLEYTKLAEAYEMQGDNITAAYFYNRVIEMAKAFNNRQHEVVAIIGISKCYDQERQTSKAIAILEEALVKAGDLQKSSIKEDLVKRISKDLIDIYMKVAEDHERAENLEDALMYFEKCLQVARQAHEHESEGKVCYRIGELYYKSGRYEKSVEFQEKYLGIIKSGSSEEGREKKESVTKTRTMEAHASLAKCYLKMKWLEQTERHLGEYNQLARELKIQNAMADSAFYLAKLNEQKGDPDKSIDHYKAYFEAAKAEKPDRKDRHLVDKGRVMFAIAKANQNMDKYIGMFRKEDSLKEVLDWKIKKDIKWG